MPGIYIHIPFCKQACSYCDFHFATSLRYKDDMLKAIMKEFELARTFIEDKNIESVYIGGGTPSILPPEDIGRLIDELSRHYHLDNVKEWTLEANPDDLTKDYLRRLKNASPVNRLSIGIQSFQSSDLELMNRAHDVSQAKWCIPAAQDAGFENLSCDLIFGMPSLSLEDLKANMDELIRYEVPHISAYALMIEKNTPLYKKISLNRFVPADDVHYEQHMTYVISYLKEQGYEQYEISNYAADAQYALHNTNYWRQVPYWGFGPSAHAYNGGTRRWNVRNNHKYITSLMNDDVIPFEEEVLSGTDKMNEYIMTSLRTMWGLSLGLFKETFGQDAWLQLKGMAEPLISQGAVHRSGDTLLLSEGSKIISDTIISELFFL